MYECGHQKVMKSNNMIVKMIGNVLAKIPPILPHILLMIEKRDIRKVSDPFPPPVIHRYLVD